MLREFVIKPVLHAVLDYIKNSAWTYASNYIRKEAKKQARLENKRAELSLVIKDVAIHVLDHCDYNSFVAFSLTSKYFNKLCQERVFPFNVRAEIYKFSLRKAVLKNSFDLQLLKCAA